MSRIGFQPDGWWPSEDELPIEVSRGGQEVLDLVFDATLRRDPTQWNREALEALAEDWPPVEPWDALFALEASRLLADAEAREVREQTDWPASVDYEQMAELAVDTLARWPDHPVSEFTSLYLLHAFGEDGATTESADALVSLALDTLEASGDDLVREAAMEHLANQVERARLDGPQLDRLWESYSDEDLLFRRLEITDLAMTSALAANDLERAAVWMEAHDRRTDESCDGHQLRPEYRPPRAYCRLRNDERDRRSALLAAHGLLQPATWQAAVRTAVRRCAADLGPRALEDTRGAAIWAGEAWVWASWEPQGPLAGCVEGTDSLTPAPPPDTRIELRVRTDEAPDTP